MVTVFGVKYGGGGCGKDSGKVVGKSSSANAQMPGLIVKPYTGKYVGEMKRRRVPRGRNCCGELLKRCQKKAVKRLPGVPLAANEWVCMMHYWRYLRYGWNCPSKREHEEWLAEMKTKAREEYK